MHIAITLHCDSFLIIFVFTSLSVREIQIHSGDAINSNSCLLANFVNAVEDPLCRSCCSNLKWKWVSFVYLQ